MLGVTLLAGCPLTRHAAAPPNQVTTPGGVTVHEGRPFSVSARDSLLLIRVYRAGTLAAVGHNHVIASHELAGTLYLPTDPAHGSFELHVPVASLTVDEPELRARQAGSDFPPDIPDSAREGTRHNMLGEALLDAPQFPEIILQGEVLTLRANGDLEARIQSSVRGQLRSFSVPLHYRLEGDALTVTGDFALRQSVLGLTPFSTLLGALQVQDEMQISVQLSGYPAAPR
jgi:hypothetical protein